MAHVPVSRRQVYMAKDKATGEVVAIKKIRSLNEVQGVRPPLTHELMTPGSINKPTF